MKKIAVVTGAGAGIGQETAWTLAEQGCIVYANARTEEKLKETISRCPGWDIRPLVFDVSREEEVRKAFEKIERVDFLVNNAGVSVNKSLDQIEAADWDLTLNTNVKGYFFVTEQARKKMAPGSSIVNLSSGAAKTGGDFVSLPYSTSKGAINSLTISYARLLAPSGIRVNAVSPGFVDTAMLVINEKITKEYYDSIIPVGRLGSPKDIAEAIRFLLSAEAGFITGQIVEVNGGDIMG